MEVMAVDTYPAAPVGAVVEAIRPFCRLWVV